MAFYLQVVLYKHVNVDFTCGKRSLVCFGCFNMI